MTLQLVPHRRVGDRPLREHCKEGVRKVRWTKTWHEAGQKRERQQWEGKGKRDATARAWKSWGWSSRRLQQGSPSQDEELGRHQSTGVSHSPHGPHACSYSNTCPQLLWSLRSLPTRKETCKLPQKNPTNPRWVTNTISRKVRVQHHHFTAHRPVFKHCRASTAVKRGWGAPRYYS